MLGETFKGQHGGGHPHGREALWPGHPRPRRHPPSRTFRGVLTVVSERKVPDTEVRHP